jgi:hypothetical protein
MLGSYALESTIGLPTPNLTTTTSSTRTTWTHRRHANNNPGDGATSTIPTRANNNPADKYHTDNTLIGRHGFGANNTNANNMDSVDNKHSHWTFIAQEVVLCAVGGSVSVYEQPCGAMVVFVVTAINDRVQVISSNSDAFECQQQTFIHVATQRRRNKDGWTSRSSPTIAMVMAHHRWQRNRRWRTLPPRTRRHNAVRPRGRAGCRWGKCWHCASDRCCCLRCLSNSSLLDELFAAAVATRQGASRRSVNATHRQCRQFLQELPTARNPYSSFTRSELGDA